MTENISATARKARLEPGDISARMTTVEVADDLQQTAISVAVPLVRPHGTSLIQSVERALDILETLAEASQELQLQDITRPCGLNASTGHHLLSTLVHRGYVARSASGRGYVLGGRLLELTRRRGGSFDMVNEVLPVVRQLSVELDETVLLATLVSSNLSILTRQDPPGCQLLPEFSLMTQAAHATAWGKAILAWLPDPQIARVVADQGLNTFTANTIGTLAELAESLRQSRRYGFALDDEEFLPGLMGVACVIRGANGEVLGALGCAIPAQRGKREYLEKVQIVLSRSATELSRRFSRQDSVPTPVPGAK